MSVSDIYCDIISVFITVDISVSDSIDSFFTKNIKTVVQNQTF